MRIKISIDPLHPGGTVCKNYQVVCSQHGNVGKPHGLRVLAEPAQSAHRDEYKKAPATTA